MLWLGCGAVALLACWHGARWAMLLPSARAAAAEAALAEVLAEPSALRCSDSNAKGTGLQADYFAGDALNGRLLLSRLEPTVEFELATDWPTAAARPRSARWQGWIKAPLKGLYHFHAMPGSTVIVAGQWMMGGKAAPDAAIELQPGRFYPIEMRADLSTNVAERLEWTAPHGLRYVVPRALLFPPSPKVAGA